MLSSKEVPTPSITDLRVESFEGPLPVHLLQHICYLYGANVDRRYAELEFTRKVFNDNPAGYSYHCFAYCGDEVIGCCGIIPVAIQGGKAWAGKAEALFLRKDFRPYGLFLIRETWQFAASHGLDFIFGLTHERLGYILRRMGFKVISQSRHQYVRLINPGNARSGKLLLTRGLSLMQGALARTVSLCVPQANVSLHVNREDYLDHAFACYSNAALAHAGCAIATDQLSLKWVNSLGALDVVSVDESREECILVTHPRRGGEAEVILWRMHPAGITRALAIIRFLLDKARQEGAAALSVNRDVITGSSREVKQALTMLGFVQRRAVQTFYVNSPDKDLLRRLDGDFAGLFSI